MRNSQGGFVGTLVLIIIGLAAAKYFFNWDIFDALSSEEGQGTVSYIRDILDIVWSYIGAPLTYVWNEVAKPLLTLAWDSFQEFIEWGRENANKQ